MLLVPADPLNPRRVDPHFAAQAGAAREYGVPVARIDHDALADPAAAVAGVPASGAAVYRGWMMTATEYDGFAAALAARGVTLRTSAADYRAAHELPGWYDTLRDYVKSMKHYWHEAAYVPDVADGSGVERVARRFRELREDAFAGGFVLRRFEEFEGAEARTWWVDGRCALVTPHPDTPDELPDGLEIAELEAVVRGLGLPFVTVDVVRRADGAWRVVELGDGQVSDWPASQDPAGVVDCLFGDNGPR